MRQLIIAGRAHESLGRRPTSAYLLHQEVIDYRLRSYVFLAVILSVTRLIGLTQQSLWFDEGYTLNLASAADFQSFLRIFASYTNSEHLQPLYYFLMYAWTRVAGTSDLALRFPSALASVISGLLVFEFLKRVPSAGNWKIALTVAGAFSLSSFSVYYAQEARPYALVQCLSFAVIVLWFRQRYPHQLIRAGRHVRSQCTASTLFFTFIVAAACLASVFTALLVVTLATVDFIRTRSASQWRQLWLTPLGVSGSSIGTYWLYAQQAFPKLTTHDIVSIKQPLWMNAGYTLYGITFGTSLAPATELLHGSNKLHVAFQFWPLLLPGALVLILTAAGTILFLRNPDPLPHPASTLALASVLYLTIFFLVFGVFGHLNILPRHASSLFAMLVLLAATIAVRLHETYARKRRGVRLLLACAFGLVSCNVASLCRYKWDLALRKDEYRAVAQHLPHDGLPVFMVAGQPLLLQHYGARVYSANNVDPSALAGYLDRNAHGTPVRLILNQYRGYRWDHSASLAVEIASRYRCTQEQHLPYMDVERCSPAYPMVTQSVPKSGASLAQ